MKTLKKTVAIIGKAIAAVLESNLLTHKDLAVRIYPEAAYAW